MNRDGKGVFEEENRKPTLGFFFKLLFRKFSSLFRLNLMMIFQLIPVVAVLIVYFNGTKTQTAMDITFAPLYGIGKSLPSSSVAAMLDPASMQMDLPVFSPIITTLMICLVVLLAITYGWQNAGATYVLRGLFRGDPVFVWSDYFYAIKKNFKQAFFMGLLDFAITVVLAIDFIYFYQRTGIDFFTDLMYFGIFALILIYITMRFYIYHLMITFDLSIFKILKNALIFTALGIKRNVLAFIGLVIVVGLHLFLIILTIPMGFSIALVLPLFYLMALCGFMSTYAAYPVIDKYMIEPWKSTDSQNDTEVEECDNETETE